MWPSITIHQSWPTHLHPPVLQRPYLGRASPPPKVSHHCLPRNLPRPRAAWARARREQSRLVPRYPRPHRRCIRTLGISGPPCDEPAVADPNLLHFRFSISISSQARIEPWSPGRKRSGRRLAGRPCPAATLSFVVPGQPRAALDIRILDSTSSRLFASFVNPVNGPELHP